MLKAASDFTIFFVFFLCSLSASKDISAAKGISETEDSSLQLVRTVIMSMWRIGVPTLSVMACTLSSWRLYARLKAGSRELDVGFIPLVGYAGCRQDLSQGSESRPAMEILLEEFSIVAPATVHGGSLPCDEPP
eukprot:COSAG05_NODE_1950_length_3794_cov_1.994317_3_plen_134_part_00